ncbi:MAG: single-stranded DNA-binding protein [Alphaproteobacteria bacterium]|nr:single-stranded DNA-binding protein [Alphaproteobacteria bacterium]
MAFQINRAEVLGFLGRDPEIRHFQDGARIATMSVATTERFRDRVSNENRERTEWHNIVVNQPNLIDDIEQLGAKGRKVFAAGTLRTRKWKDRDGNDRYTTEIVVTNRGNFEFIQRADSSEAPAETAPPANEAPPPGLINDEDLTG